MVCWQQAKMLYKYRASLHTRMRTHTPPDEQNQSSGTAELRLYSPKIFDGCDSVKYLGGLQPPKYLTDVIPSNIWGVYSPQNISRM